jgi:hypothetical protein
VLLASSGDDQPARRHAALAGREERALHAELNRLRPVGIVQNDLRVLATHLQLHLLEVGGALLGNAMAHALRAGEADGVDAGVVFQAGLATGKFQGVIRPITPTGSRVISTLTPERTEGTISPLRRTTCATCHPLHDDHAAETPDRQRPRRRHSG